MCQNKHTKKPSWKHGGTIQTVAVSTTSSYTLQHAHSSETFQRKVEVVHTESQEQKGLQKVLQRIKLRLNGRESYEACVKALLSKKLEINTKKLTMIQINKIIIYPLKLRVCLPS